MFLGILLLHRRGKKVVFGVVIDHGFVKILSSSRRLGVRQVVVHECGYLIHVQIDAGNVLRFYEIQMDNFLSNSLYSSWFVTDTPPFRGKRTFDPLVSLYSFENHKTSIFFGFPQTVSTDVWKGARNLAGSCLNHSGSQNFRRRMAAKREMTKWGNYIIIPLASNNGELILTRGF